MRVYKPLNHLPFSVSYSGHIDAEAVDADTEVFAAPDIVRDLCRMDNIFTGKTCDVGTGSADILALHDCNALSLSCEGPSEQFRASAAAKDEEIVNFWLRLKIHICCSPL